MQVDRRVELDVIGALSGTDKSSSESFSWDYLRHYETFFDRFRHEPVNLVEIGVQRGPSIKAWKAWFTQATIVGVDIDPNCRRLTEDRVVIEIGSQYDAAFLADLCAKHPPSIFIDDGSHLAHHMIFTFEKVFPELLPGGLYVIEDFAFHADAKSSETGELSAPDYFMGLTRSLLVRREPGEDDADPRRQLLGLVDEISVIGGTIVIQKKYLGRDLDLAMKFSEPFLTNPDALTRLANFSNRHGGSLENAEGFARKALELQGFEKTSVRALVDILLGTGRVPEAVELARRSVEALPNDTHRLMFLGYVQERNGDIVGMVDSYRRAVAMEPDDMNFYFHFALGLGRLGQAEEALTVLDKIAGRVAGRFDEAVWAERLSDLEAHFRAELASTGKPS